MTTSLHRLLDSDTSLTNSVSVKFFISNPDRAGVILNRPIRFGFMQGKNWIRDWRADLLANRRCALIHDGAFHGVQCVHESGHVAHIDAMVPAGRRRTAGQEMNIGTLAADKQDSFS